MFWNAILWSFAILFSFALADDDGDGSQALVVPASEYFEGNDGPWSTFDLRVGTSEQYVRVLVSTASPESLVVLSDLGCSSSVFDDVPSDCAVSRGKLFSPNDSSSWQDLGNYGINGDGVGLEANLDYEQSADFGQESLGVGLTGPKLSDQIVGGIATAEPFYLGILGINNQPLNFTTLGNHSAQTFLTTLKDKKKIPSLSWSYTAGAKYRLKQVYGQLIFSGYDTSRFDDNTISFTMADDVTRDLVVGLQSISYSGSTSETLLSDPIDIFVDSTDPNLWLPDDVCDAFEDAFDLELDDDSGLYLVNDTHRNDLLDSNAEVSFRLSDAKSGGETVVVTLPYASFDLQADVPLVDSKSYYFPLKRANDSSQYTLGRVFLQEAYLSVDYERKVFNVSACVWNEGADENVVTITSKDSDSNSDDEDGGGGDNGGGSNGGSGDDSSSSDDSGLSTGAIAGIAVGCGIAAILIIAALIVLLLRKRRKWLKKGFADAGKTPEPSGAMLAGPPMFNSHSNSQMNSSSLPMTAADISGTNSMSNIESSTRPSAVVEHVAGTSTPELDGKDTHIRSNTEIDSNELRPPRALVDTATFGAGGGNKVHELPGSQPLISSVTGSRRTQESSESSGGSDQRNSDGTTPSPLVSTLDTTQGERELSELISPISPTHTGRRPF